MKYIEIALGAFTNRGKIILETELESYIKKAQELELPLFRSYFSYDEKVLQHIGKTLKAYTGTAYVNTLIFDIDKAGDKDAYLHLRAKDFAQNLMNNWDLNEDTIGLWYSGNGFHIEIPNIFEFQPDTQTDTIKRTLTHYFPQGDNIYDKTRLIRVGDTVNNKTNRYKILLTMEEFFDLPIEDIIALSREPRDITAKKFGKFPTFPELIIKTEKLSIRSQDIDKDSTTKIVTCMQKLYNRGASKGTRHTDILRLASSWRRAGIPYKGIVAMLERWAPSLEVSEITHVVDGVFKHKYQYSCKDPVFEKYCDPNCIFYSKKNYSPEIHDSQSLETSYTKFIKRDFSDSSFDLSEIYALDAKFNILPGELVMVIGDTKLGKSAWIQNICTSIKLPVLYLSLEMHERLTFRRFIQIAHHLSKEEVNTRLAKGEKLAQKINHIRIMSVAPELNTIKKLITDSEAKVIIIDVIDAIDVKGVQDDNKITPIINELKNAAQQLDVIIVGVHHISKSSARETMLDIHSGKGSSSVEQKADKVIAIEGDRMKPYRKISSLGARDEHPFKIITQMSPKTFEFRQVRS